MCFSVFSETSKFDPISVPTWLYFRTQNPSKSMKNRFEEASKKWSIFGSLFCPSWLYFGTQVGTQEPLKTVPKRLPEFFLNFPRRHQDSSRGTRASKIEIWSIFGPKIRWGTLPGLEFSRFFGTFQFKFWYQICDKAALIRFLDGPRQVRKLSE